VSEIPELDRRATTSSLELPSSQSGWPQESLVLQLYGIAKPSLSFLTRLSHIVNMKLDDATLEVMCALYARNQKLSLYPVDVQFLQPSQSEVSHVMNIPIPPWISMVDAFLFYLLQTLSAMALRPRYTSTDTRDHFCVAHPLHNAYVNSGLPQELHQDHPGASQMKGSVRSYFWWTGLDKEIENLSKSCVACQSVRHAPPTAPLHPWVWPSRPWQRIHVDFTGPFLGKSFLVVEDAHSKWPEVFEMSSTTSLKTIATLRHLFAAYGLPEQLVSDNGPQFT